MNQYNLTRYKDLLFSYYIKLKHIYDYFQGKDFSLLSDNGDFLEFINENVTNTNENEFPNIILDNYLKWKKTKQILVICPNSYKYIIDFKNHIGKISNIIGGTEENWDIHYLPGSMDFLTDQKINEKNRLET